MTPAGTIAYSLEDLYRLRDVPLAHAPLPAQTLAFLHHQSSAAPAANKGSRWNTVRRHDTPGTKATSESTAATAKPGAEAENCETQEEPKTAATPPPPPAPAAAVAPAPIAPAPVPTAVASPAPPPTPAAAPQQPPFQPLPAVPTPTWDSMELLYGPPPGWTPPNPSMPEAVYEDKGPAFDDWDLPAAGEAAAPMECFTLGDIREAESTVEGLGVPLNIYIDRVRRQQGNQAPPHPAEPAANPPPPYGNSYRTMYGGEPPPVLPSVQPRQPPPAADIFFGDNGACGESRFMSIFERNRRQQASRLNGNAKPFYPTRYNQPQQAAASSDDPRKYATYLQQRHQQALAQQRQQQQQQQQQQQAAAAASTQAANKVTTQQLVQIIQNISKNQGTVELSDRQKELLHAAAARVKQLQQQQQVMMPAYSMPPPAARKPAEQPPPLNASQSEKITAMAEALQRSLQQQHAKGQPVSAPQKQMVAQVLQALQRLKAQRNYQPRKATDDE